MKKEPRIFDTILAMTFLIGLFLPLALTHNQDVSPIEKRKLVPFPELNWHSNTVTKFPSKFEAYFNDHFGFRDSLAQIHYLIDIKLKSSSMPRILIGEDGWLFFVDPMDGNSLEDFRGNDPFTPTQLKTWRSVLEDRYYWLKQQGIRYLFVVAPDKHTIYGEYIPARIRQVGKQSRFDQLLEYMKDSEVPILDLRPALLQAKAKQILYYKTNTHWNHAGAAVAQYEIIRQLKQYFPNLQPISFHEQDFSLIKHTGDITYMLNLSTVLKEEAPILKNPLPSCNPQIFEGSPELKFEQRFYANCQADGPRALVFRDSFFDFLHPYISQYFSKSYYVWTGPNFDAFEHFVESTSPNLVIEERVERHLTDMPELPNSKNKAYHISTKN